MNSLNFKSMALGIVLGAILVIGIAAATQTITGGRYQLLASEGYLFKIDTSTGQVWKTLVSRTDAEFLKPNEK